MWTNSLLFSLYMYSLDVSLEIPSLTECFVTHERQENDWLVVNLLAVLYIDIFVTCSIGAYVFN